MHYVFSKGLLYRVGRTRCELVARLDPSSLDTLTASVAEMLRLASAR